MGQSQELNPPIPSLYNFCLSICKTNVVKVSFWQERQILFFSFSFFLSWSIWLDSFTDSMGMSLSKFQETMKDREVWDAAVHGVAKSRTRLSNWTATIVDLPCCVNFYHTTKWFSYTLAIYIYIYIYTHTYIYIYIHTHSFSYSFPWWFITEY